MSGDCLLRNSKAQHRRSCRSGDSHSLSGRLHVLELNAREGMPGSSATVRSSTTVPTWRAYGNGMSRNCATVFMPTSRSFAVVLDPTPHTALTSVQAIAKAAISPCMRSQTPFSAAATIDRAYVNGLLTARLTSAIDGPRTVRYRAAMRL